MSRMRKAAVLLTTTVMAFACAAAGCFDQPAGTGGEDGGEREPPVIQPQDNEVVKSVSEIGIILGENSKWNDTVTEARVAGTDLGIPVYDTANQRMLLLFGDTFSKQVKGEGSGTGDWRSNVCAYSTDFNLSDGITLDGWITPSNRPSGMAKELISARHTDNVEMTTIPTGAIEINGTIYMFYMSVRHWGANGVWDVSYCGLAKSTDGGQSYQKIPEFSFVGIRDLTTAELCGLESADMRLHYAPNFSQIWPLEHEGYIYLYGIPGGRFGGVKLARVAKADFPDFSQIEWYTGTENGEEVFVKGEAGRKLIADEDSPETGLVIEASAGEMCVVWNEYLEKFVTIYQRGSNLLFRTSETPWGEWSKPVTLLGYNDYNAMYCGFMHPRYTEQDGKVIYFFMSYWWDYEVILMKLELN